jgi:hypothetical protein
MDKSDLIAILIAIFILSAFWGITFNAQGQGALDADA